MEVVERITDIKVSGSPFSDYMQYDGTFKEEMVKASESFVKIGYLLKVARDTDILVGSEFKDYLAYAKKRFSLDASTVSRFININSRYSVDGNSPTLDEKYIGYGRAKLQEMLTLPDYLTESLTPELSKSEIHTIKQEYDEEQAITPLEVMIEPDQRTEETELQRFMYKLLKTETELFRALYEFGASTGEIIDILLPDDLKIYIARPEGLGKMQLKLTRENEGAELLNIRTGEKWIVTDEKIAEAVTMVLSPGLSEFLDCEAGYEKKYGEPFPKTEIAPVQQAAGKVVVAKDKPKSVQKKPKSVEKQEKTAENAPETSEPEVLTSAPAAPDHQPDPLPVTEETIPFPGEDKPAEAEKPAETEKTETGSDAEKPESRINTPAQEDSREDEKRPEKDENNVEDWIISEENELRNRHRKDIRNYDDHGLTTTALIACDVLRENWNGVEDESNNKEQRMKIIMNKTYELLELAQELKRREYNAE